MEGEQIVGIVYNAEGQVGRLALLKMYDLVFTDRRLVGVSTAKTGAAGVVGSALGGSIGNLVARSVAKGGVAEKRSRYVNVRLDDIVADDKANFAAPYAQIENTKIKGLFTKYLHMKVQGKKAVFKIPKEQVAAVHSLAARAGGK